MNWIKFETATSHKPEVWQMAEELGIDPDAVVGKLLRVWAWFDEQTQDGNAPSVTKALLDRYVGVTGFCNSMKNAGWLLEMESSIQLPNFDRHNGATAKKRVLSAKRVANYRNSNADVTHVKQNCNAPSVTDALPRIDKNRIDKNINTPHSPPGGKRGRKAAYQFSVADIPESLKIGNPQHFYRAWARWIQHRHEIKKPITPTSAEQQLKQFELWGVDRAVAAIEYTIAKGWQGLKEPEGRDKQDSFDEEFARMHERVSRQVLGEVV